jgi:flagellar hook-basal body complex protein FliE
VGWPTDRPEIIIAALATTESTMKVGGIDSHAIEAMVAQLRAAARAHPGVSPVTAPATSQSATKVDFSAALKSSLDSVAASQNQADQLSQQFTMGDDKVNLSDVMISMQKANISFQATVQVRNKLVSAYQEMMNMQV